MIQHETKAARARQLASRGKAKPAIAQRLKMRSDEVNAALSRGDKRGRLPSENVHALTVRLPGDVMARINEEAVVDGGESSRNGVIVAALRQALIDEV